MTNDLCEKCGIGIEETPGGCGCNIISPAKCLCFHALDGYETYIIDKKIIGVRPFWISIKDRLPNENVTVLVTDGVSTWVAMLQICMRKSIWWASHPDYKRDYWHDEFPANIYLTIAKPLFWMPLPEPPK